MEPKKIYKKAINKYLENNNKNITIVDISNFIKENYEKELNKNDISSKIKTIKRTVAKMLNNNDYLEYFNLRLKSQEKRGATQKKIFEKNESFEELFSEEDEVNEKNDNLNNLFDDEDELDDLFDDDDDDTDEENTNQYLNDISNTLNKIKEESDLKNDQDDEKEEDVIEIIGEILEEKLEIKHIDHDTFYDLSFVIGELLQYDIDKNLKNEIKEKIYITVLKKLAEKYISKMKISISRIESNNS